MKKKHNIPEQVVEVLKDIGMSSAEAGWDCHGTYVLLHKALEKVAAKRNVVFGSRSLHWTDGRQTRMEHRGGCAL